ncbi:MAG: PH domain-containing protein, partial [Mycobacterium sp.]|nr:PH domain-containing protein [Mycobacterium sp.]
MLLVHPVHEVVRQLPVLIGSLVLGSATGNPLWTLLGLGLIIAFGLARWFTTTYRIGADEVQLRTGVLQRKVLSVPRNRIRSVSTDARLLHRLLGLTVLQVSTGQEAAGDTSFALDVVPAREVPGLRATLLAESLAPGPLDHGRMLARWQPSWLRYSPLTLTGLLMIAAAFGVIYQTGVVAALENSGLARIGVDAAENVGVLGVVVVGVLVIVAASVALSVAQSLLTYANLQLRRDAEILHLSHGLMRVREHTYDMRRLRGGSLREPLMVRLFGGARLDAVMTGVAGAGEASQLLPPCPRLTAETVLADLIAQPDAVTGPLTPHGPAATRRRWFRAMVLPGVVAAGLVALAITTAVSVWVWPALVVLTLFSVFLAVD